MFRASAAPTPATCSRSATPARITPCSPPKCVSRARRRDGPESRHRFQDRFVVAPRALAAMAGDRKAMRLVADPLHQARSGRMRFEHARCGRAVDEEPLLPRPAVRPLGDADQRDVVEAQLLEHLVHLADLAEAAVDQQQVRRRDLAIPDARVAPRERLPQARRSRRRA